MRKKKILYVLYFIRNAYAVKKHKINTALNKAIYDKTTDYKYNKRIRISILTFHCAHNYGAVLQCFASQEVLKEMGYTVEIIDYRPVYLTRPLDIINPNRILLRDSIRFTKRIIA